MRLENKALRYLNRDVHPEDQKGKIFDTDKVVDKCAFNTITSILKHKDSVRSKLLFIARELTKRSAMHDDSKLQSPEIDWLIEMDKEPRVEYGSKEYYQKMHKWHKFFTHHYNVNRHHPDHFINGIDGMNLVDLSEYLIDIISYFDEMHVGDAIRVIEEQKSRFRLSDQLAQILKNTLIDYFAWVGDNKPDSMIS